MGEPYPRLEAWLFDKDPADALYWRVWDDARYIGRLWDAMVRLLSKKPDGEDLLRLYQEVELPLIPVLLDMECRGIWVNQPRAANMVVIIDQVLDYLRDKISKSMGGALHFNPMNDDHVEQLLVRGCGADLQEAAKATRGCGNLPPRTQQCRTSPAIGRLPAMLRFARPPHNSK